MTTTASITDPLQRVVSRLRGLYSLPAVVTRLLELTEAEQADARILKQTLESDPAMTARILRLVNSAFFGLRGEVTNLQQALALLGSKPLRMSVLALGTPQELLAGIESPVLDRFWRHTLYRAAVARLLAERRSSKCAEEAFVAGLLQGIGMLALLQEFGTTYARFLDHVYALGGSMRTQEREVLGFDHPQVACELLRRWNLPELLANVVGRGEFGAAGVRNEESLLAEDLRLADAIAFFLVSSDRGSLSAIHELASAGARFEESELPEILERLETQVRPLCDLFEISPNVAGLFAQKLAEAGRPREAETGNTDTETTTNSEWSQVLREASELRRTARAAARSIAVPPPPSREVESPVQSLERALVLALEECRAQRAPLSLLLVEIDRIDELSQAIGLSAVKRFAASVERMLRETPEIATVIAEKNGRWSAVLPDCDRIAAAAVGKTLLEFVRHATRGLSQRISLSVGLSSVSLPPRNLPTRELLSVAARCLQAAQTSGGDAVKSFEI